MNNVQKIGLAGSILCVILAMVGYMQRMNTGETTGAWSMMFGLGVVGLLVCLLVFAIGRMMGTSSGGGDPMQAERERSAKLREKAKKNSL